MGGLKGIFGNCVPVFCLLSFINPSSTTATDIVWRKYSKEENDIFRVYVYACACACARVFLYKGWMWASCIALVWKLHMRTNHSEKVLFSIVNFVWFPNRPKIYFVRFSWYMCFHFSTSIEGYEVTFFSTVTTDAATAIAAATRCWSGFAIILVYCCHIHRLTHWQQQHPEAVAKPFKYVILWIAYMRDDDEDFVGSTETIDVKMNLF